MNADALVNGEADAQVNALFRAVEAVAQKKPVAIVPLGRSGGYTQALRRIVRFSDNTTAFLKAATSDDTARWIGAERKIYEALNGASFLPAFFGGGRNPHNKRKRRNGRTASVSAFGRFVRQCVASAVDKSKGKGGFERACPCSRSAALNAYLVFNPSCCVVLHICIVCVVFLCGLLLAR